MRKKSAGEKSNNWQFNNAVCVCMSTKSGERAHSHAVRRAGTETSNDYVQVCMFFATAAAATVISPLFIKFFSLTVDKITINSHRYRPATKVPPLSKCSNQSTLFLKFNFEIAEKLTH